MKKKNYYIVATIFFVVLICVIYLICNNKHTEEINYIGKTRQEVLELCEKYSKFKGNGISEKIMIIVGPTFRYYNTIEEALDSKPLMEAPLWQINFNSGYKKFYKVYYFYNVFFDKNGVVYKQKQGYMRRK